MFIHGVKSPSRRRKQSRATHEKTSTVPTQLSGRLETEPLWGRKKHPTRTQPATWGPSGQHGRPPDPAHLAEHSAAFPNPGPSGPLCPHERWDKDSAGELGRPPKGACGQASEPGSTAGDHGRLNVPVSLRA